MIDWVRVADLRSEVGEDSFAEVIELFLEETDEVAARLRRGSGGSLRDDMHFLKGSALNLGFRDLAALCQEGERRAAAGAAVDLTAVLDCYARSRDAFHAGLRRRPAA